MGGDLGAHNTGARHGARISNKFQISEIRCARLFWIDVDDRFSNTNNKEQRSKATNVMISQQESKQGKEEKEEGSMLP